MASFNPDKIANKLKRQQQHLKRKKQLESTKRDERLKRRRTEDKNPQLREARRARNRPATLDSKRKWDDADLYDEAEPKLGLAVDILNPARKKTGEADPRESRPAEADGPDGAASPENEDDDHDDHDSMLDSESSGDEEGEEATKLAGQPPDRPPSEAPSTATEINLTPEALIQRFPTLFHPPESPKVLITTSINSTMHHEAHLLTVLFPHSTYIRRSAHFHSYKYSLREITRFAAARDYTTVVVLNEDRKRPKGLDVVHLPHGPTFHFSISNWVEGRRLPGHGNPTNHHPELILNGFRTPLGLLTAHLFRSLFPQHPEIQGRQVVTLHNQRDYIFFRRHRYVFRDKRGGEKSIQGADGKPVKGVEEIRTGLQELGPRFTLKLRRIDRGIQHASGQEWEWKAHDEKVRTRFSL